MGACNRRGRCGFFFQAEDGIRDLIVTGVQTCALPISTCAFAVSAQVVGHATYPSILEIDREVRGVASGAAGFAITPDELEREKMGAVLGLPGRFATAQAALGQYRALVYFGLPLDYYATYVERIS